jgi:glycosyltransferase involved in cell wall biosynthesis
MAVDDYLGAFVRGGLGYRRRLQPRRVFAAKWRVEYLLPGHNRPRELALRWLTRTGLRAWHANLLAFDERLADAATRPPGTGVLPDLWFGEFSDRHRPAARQQHGFTATDYVALTVGRQDERKGLPVVLAAFESLLTRWPDLVLFVVGPVADRLRPGLDRLRRAHGATRVRQHPEFVPEADMPRVFAAADVVLLPYARQFTASSGVLPRAAASGVPVVASDHGLVGHRVRRWQLGETFPAGSAPALGAALERLRQQQATFDPAGLRAYAAASSLAAFQAAARRAILGDS